MQTQAPQVTESSFAKAQRLLQQTQQILQKKTNPQPPQVVQPPQQQTQIGNPKQQQIVSTQNYSEPIVEPLAARQEPLQDKVDKYMPQLQTDSVRQQIVNQGQTTPQREPIQQTELIQQRESIQQTELIQPTEPIEQRDSIQQRDLILQREPIQQRQSIQQRQPIQQRELIPQQQTQLIYNQQEELFLERHDSPIQQIDSINQVNNDYDTLKEEPINQDFEFVFIMRALNRQQREDHLRSSSRIWKQIEDKSQNNFLLNILAKIMQDLLVCFDGNLLDDSMFQQVQQILQLLEQGLQDEFIQTYDSLFEQQGNWETILLVTLGFGQNEINIGQQAIMVDYLTQRSYQNQEEAIILLATTIIKMEASELKVTKLLQLYDAMTQNQTYTQFIAQLLWLILKMYPKYLSIKNIVDFFNEISLHINKEVGEAYFNSLLIFNAISGGQMTNQLVNRAQTFNHLGFLECQAIKFQKQLPGLFYHLLAEKCVEKQKQKAALEFLKHAIALGHVQSSALREKLILDSHQQSNQPKQAQVSQPFGGLFDSFKSVIAKTIKPEAPVAQEKDQEKEKGNFYYDHTQKAWVINGQIAQEDEDSKEKKLDVEVVPPPKPVLPPTQQRGPSFTAPVANKIEQKQPQQSIQMNPFSTQSDVVQQDATRQKKSNLMRNRYVQ